LPFLHEKSIDLKKGNKKKYGNSNISPCKKYNLQKNPLKKKKKKNQNPSRYLVGVVKYTL
jgi:hypothetical protein